MACDSSTPNMNRQFFRDSMGNLNVAALSLRSIQQKVPQKGVIYEATLTIRAAPQLRGRGRRVLPIGMLVLDTSIGCISKQKNKRRELSMRKYLIVGVLFLLVAAISAIVEFAPPQAQASSHREAPSISQDPAADNTDTYIFRSPDAPGTITLIADYYPYEGPAGGPNFYRFGDDVLYEFHIDNDGDAKDEITYQFRFKTSIKNNNTFLYNTGTLNDPNTYANWSLRQTYTVTRVTPGHGSKTLGKNLNTPPSNVGTHSISSYAPLRNAAIYTIDSDIKVFAGQRADPFFGDVGSIFDLLTIRGGIPAGFSSGGHNSFANYNLQTIALQVPIAKLTNCACVPASGDLSKDVVGFWASASRKVLGTTGGNGGWRQVSRLGLPLTNEVVIPMSMKDKFNASQPKDDVANFAGPVVTPELAGLLHSLYGLTVPPSPRNDLVQTLLEGVPGLNQPTHVVPSDMLRLNVTTGLCGGGNPACNNIGVIAGDPQGFPNGRRLNDDVIDAAERVVAGGYVLAPTCNGGSPSAWCGSPNSILGDGVNSPNVAPMGAFPYVPDPYDGFTHP